MDVPGRRGSQSVPKRPSWPAGEAKEIETGMTEAMCRALGERRATVEMAQKESAGHDGRHFPEARKIQEGSWSPAVESGRAQENLTNGSPVENGLFRTEIMIGA